MVLVLDVFFDFVVFNVACVSPGRNVDLHVIQCRRKNGTNTRIQAPGRKLVFMKKRFEIKASIFLSYDTLFSWDICRLTWQMQ